VRTSTVLRFVPGIAIAALLAAGASSGRTAASEQVAPLGQHALPARGSLSQPRLRVRGSTKGAKLFVSTPATGTVNVYNKKGHLQGQITGFGDPGGLAVDASGNLYVCDEINLVIDVFAPGGSKPKTVLTDGTSAPVYVAVGTDGTVYASNATNGVPGSISLWAPGHTQPTATITDSNVFNFHGLALDSNNNLFAAWSSNKGTAGVDEVPSGSTTPTNLGLHGLLVPIGLTVDNQNALVIADAGDGSVKVFPQGATSATRAFSGFAQASLLAFDSTGKVLFVSDAQAAHVVVLGYERGNVKYTVTSGLSASNYAWGVALDPAAAP